MCPAFSVRTRTFSYPRGVLLAILVGAGLMLIGSPSAQADTIVPCYTGQTQTGSFTISDSHEVLPGTSCEGDAIIPTSVTSIGDNAFALSVKLKSVTFAAPSSVTRIGADAFVSATGLTSITFPSSVGEIGNDAFDGTSNLTSLFFEGNAPLLDYPGDTFDNGPPNETFYHFSNATGFTVVPWDGLILALYLPVPPVPTAIAGVESATISVQPAAIGPPPTSFTITSNPGTATCTVTGASGSCTISGLTVGTSYTFTTVAHEGPTDSVSSAESAAVIPIAAPPIAPAIPIALAMAPPSMPGQIVWHIPHLVSEQLVVSFPAADSTTYTIFGTFKSTKRLHPLPRKTTRGTCRIMTNATTNTSTAKCTVRFDRSGTWLVTITPTQNGVSGVPVRKTLTIHTAPPAKSAKPTEPVTG